MRSASAAITLVLAGSLLAGCTGATASASAPAAPPAPVPADVSITPNDGTDTVLPNGVVTVSARTGTLNHVDVTDPSGVYLLGSYNVGHTVWTSTAPLVPASDYAVKVSTTGPTGDLADATSAFATAAVDAAKRLLVSQVTPADGDTVGVAYPLVVQFNHSVINREEVTKKLQVTTTPQVNGAWYWIDAQTVDYRPQGFWPEGTVVKLNANLTGVSGGNGLWGVKNLASGFTVGRQQVIKVNVKTHKLTVVRDGKTIASFPVSTGKPGWETRGGTKVIMEKVLNKHWTNTAIDAPEAYSLYSAHAMRMTNSGEFIHDAPWNTGNIGAANTSHGCVGMTVSDMAWLYDHTIVGDAVIVTGSPKPYTEIYNRYQDWNVSWTKWQTGNYNLSDG
ncbi:MAG TPA: Ig-like domain-containing protein [Sporichthyaceae bacterium]|nr:Ig-like domain-containing protein [Sporichthyaceae bacterium]